MISPTKNWRMGARYGELKTEIVGDGRAVAVVWTHEAFTTFGDDGRRTSGVRVDAEGMANLHMVLASEDMLKALERVGCQDAGSCGPNEPDGRCFVCAAIAKARGR